MWKKTLSHPANDEKTLKKAGHRFIIAAGLAAYIHLTSAVPERPAKSGGLQKFILRNEAVTSAQGKHQKLAETIDSEESLSLYPLG